MDSELARINELHLWDFEVARRDEATLLILGSNDFVYGHYLEAEFTGVVFCDLPNTFSHAEFKLGATAIWVYAESMETTATEFEIQATGVQVRIGRVSYTR